jgi:xanthine dehydrogenase small subunit
MSFFKYLYLKNPMNTASSILIWKTTQKALAATALARNLHARWQIIFNEAPMTSQPLHFFKGGAMVTVQNVLPTRTLLEVLREDVACTAAKEGCAQGDCGACTVVIAQPVYHDDEHPQLEYKAINSCIRLAHSVDGLAVWTAQDIAPAAGLLHPAQQAMVDCHGSQCGFCTPGFVMSLFGMYQHHVQQDRQITRAWAQEALSGNLCRCTGYRPILDAAMAMPHYPRPAANDTALLNDMLRYATTKKTALHPTPYQLPTSLNDALQARARNPDAQLVAGCTDVGLWVTKQHQHFAAMLDITRVHALRQIQQYPHHVAIGAAATLQEAYAALVALRPQLTHFASRFAGLPVRHAGTLGGNVANGSPIGDSMPLLIALNASVVLMRWYQGKAQHREAALEQLYTGYRTNIIAADELLAWVKVPRPQAGEFMRAYKISKRHDDDISAVCLAVQLHVDDGKVSRVSIGAGGVAATPARATKTEAFLHDRPWTQRTVQEAIACLRAEFTPLSDMRASAEYRSAVLGNLMQRYWLESQGQLAINLEDAHWLEHAV